MLDEKTSCSLIHWWRWNKVSELFVNDVGAGPQDCGICYSVCARNRKQMQTQTETWLFGTNPIWRHSHINPLSFILLIAFSFLLQFRTPEGAAKKGWTSDRKVFRNDSNVTKMRKLTMPVRRVMFQRQAEACIYTWGGVPQTPKLVKWVFLETHVRVSGPVCVCIMVCERLAKYLMKVKADKHWTWNLMNI